MVCLKPWSIYPPALCDRGWVEPRAGLDAMDEVLSRPSPYLSRHELSLTRKRHHPANLQFFGPGHSYIAGVSDAAQAVTRRPLAAKFRVRSRAVHVGFAVENVALSVLIRALMFFAAGLSYHSFTLFSPLPTLYSLSNRQRC
jgi:hypothetical protein